MSYPGNKRFRTGATVAMFALVILSVTTISFLTAEQSAALNQAVVQDSGGYDIVTQTGVNITNLAPQISQDPNLNGKVAAVTSFNTTSLFSARDTANGQDYGQDGQVSLVGGDPFASGPSNFYTTNTFPMVLMAGTYKTSSDVWKAVISNSSNVVYFYGAANTRGPPTSTQTPAAGDLLQISESPDNGRTVYTTKVTVAGVMNSFLLGTGIMGTDRLLSQFFHVGSGQFSLVKVTSGTNPTIVSNTMKRDLAQLGLATIVIPVLISDFIQVGQSFLGIFEAFLALGLVVGIAGLGIISIRSVVERRKEIGVLRAIGFRKRMVLFAFLLENSYVALLGIFIGVVLGFDLGYAIATSPGSGFSYVIPWTAIAEIIAFSYALAVLTTLSSSRRAASIPPAEALRYTE